tara:strand:- start:378 stop:755 length:378 start_codon:yes stop_codon:yes gene_type:complete
MSTLKVNTIQNTSAAHSSTPQQIAEGRAKIWVNFDGEGTVSIRDDFNVSSITDNGTGDYTVNFSTNMSNDDYAALVTPQRKAGTSEATADLFTLNSNNVRVLTLRVDSGANLDVGNVCVAIFGDQ